MSTETTTAAETEPFTTPSHPSDGSGNDIMRDIVLWRRKKLGTFVLIAATATWVLMEVYQYNFLTLISWLTILVITSIFLYAKMLTLFGKEPPKFLRLEFKEETAIRMAKIVKARIEESIRWLFMVTTKEDWFVLVGVMARFLALSYVGTCMDFLTFIYIGILGCMTVPVIYMKNEDKIKKCLEWLREKYKRSYEVIDEKAIKNIKSRILNEKKIE
ncbi:reticulon-like protein B13 [Vicia villosa]|uniref:reticulon-like protein B13 n=1 Tax=Vicia villosa TaxID=3911 RepID=UPI00273C26ED|nr:reticulon-like protein B13 [Vicia villosa]